ncbi:MAG: hypothetical protein NTX23_06935 [Candidatus Bipolaricaulota bacterium]|nr:hypothetical protein [Candidatus Bipolaricaulota bacterium]
MSRWRGLVDAVSEADGALRFGEAAVDRDKLVEWLLRHQIQAGRDAGLFRPTAEDFEERRLPTGERLKTKLATTQTMSQEAARILHAMSAGSREVEDAVARTAARLGETCYALQHCTIGECAASFAGYMRFLRGTLGGASAPEMTWRLQTLSEHRDGKGRWKRFPAYYTVLVLSEIDLPAARDELVYAAPIWSPPARAASVEEPYARRRSLLQSDLESRGLGPRVP